jgi:hypothetical protein
MAMPVYPDHY